MSVNGCLTRSVLDTALFLDVTAGGGLAPEKPPPPERAFVEAARTSPGKLRIAVSVKGTRALAPPMLDERCRRAVEQTAELLGSLGHEVSWRDPEVGNGGQRRRDPLLARRRRRRPPTSQSRAAGPAGARRRPPGLSGPRLGPAAHQGGDLEARGADQPDLRGRTTCCCFR